MALDCEIYMTDDDYEAMQEAKSQKYWANIDERDEFVSDLNEAHEQGK